MESGLFVAGLQRSTKLRSSIAAMQPPGPILAAFAAPASMHEHSARREDQT